MAQKTIPIGEQQITIRRITVLESRLLPEKLAGQFDAIANWFNTDHGAAEEKTIQDLIVKNFDWVCGLILSQTVDYTDAELCKLDMVDLIELAKEILAYNGITQGRLKSFFGLIKTAIGMTKSKFPKILMEDIANHPMFQGQPVKQ